MSLYIITHKYLNDRINMDNYKYLYVGAHKQENKNDEYIYDDFGDNISKKNSNYCELTGIYWIWKNSEDEYKGIVHYRRFFTKHFFSKKSKYFYTTDELNKMLEKYDILVAERLYIPEKSVYDDYAKYHYKHDLENLRNVIKKVDSKCLDSFDKVFNRKYYSPCNMMYCHKDVFDEYCKWLFCVFDELEKVTDLSEYNEQQARIYGFMSERLLNVWIEYKNLNKKELKIIQLDSKVKFRIRKIIERIVKKSLKGNFKYDK